MWQLRWHVLAGRGFSPDVKGSTKSLYRTAVGGRGGRETGVTFRRRLLLRRCALCNGLRQSGWRWRAAFLSGLKARPANAGKRVVRTGYGSARFKEI